MPMPAAATQHEPVDMAAVAAKSARALAICKAATSAASDSSGAETAPNAGPTRLTLRQSSFASSDTGQQMTPELDTLARRSVSNAAAAAPASVATAVTVVPAPEVAASPAASSGVPIAGGGGTVRLTAAAVKLEPVSYGGGGGGVIVPTLKAESIPQLAPGGSGWMPQAAAARALSNRQSAARSKVTAAAQHKSFADKITCREQMFLGAQSVGVVRNGSACWRLCACGGLRKPACCSSCTCSA